MNILKAIRIDRFGPDIIWTHWMLYFKHLSKYLAKRKIGEFGVGSSVRPYVTIVGGSNISIGRNVTLRPFTQMHAGRNVKIVIEDDVLLAPNVFITTNNHKFNNINTPILKQGGTSKSVLIKEGAWIAANVVILQGVTIGKNSVVAAGAVVANDVPDYCVVGGVPAKIIKEI